MSGIAIFGATGAVGESVVFEALGRRLEVSALVRNPRKVRRFNELFTMFQGDLTTGEGVDATLRDRSSVVWAVGPGIATRCLSDVLERVARRPIRAFVFVSFAAVSPVARLQGMVHGPPESDPSSTEALLRDSRVPWTILRPAAFTRAAHGAPVLIAPSGDRAPQAISRPDFARVVLDAAERADWIRQELVVGTRSERRCGDHP